MSINLFSNRKIYGGKWSVKSSRKFTEEEKSLVLKAQVVDSQYGSSCCFLMKNGTSVYIPMASDAVSSVGDVINLDTADIVTLEKPGEANIERIRG